MTMCAARPNVQCCCNPSDGLPCPNVTMSRVREALTKLANEAICLIGAYQVDIRDVMGNTNFAVLTLRIDEARAALASSAAQAQGATTLLARIAELEADLRSARAALDTNRICAGPPCRWPRCDCPGP